MRRRKVNRQTKACQPAGKMRDIRLASTAITYRPLDAATYAENDSFWAHDAAQACTWNRMRYEFRLRECSVSQETNGEMG